MSRATKERLKGKAQEIEGAVKRTVGNAIGNDRLAAEGYAKEAGGKARQETVKAGERVRGAVEGVAGRVKEVAGTLVDDPELELEGKADRLKGKARRVANK
jgi:uncharacterized protein YjbJ (UPF0337 family)